LDVVIATDKVAQRKKKDKKKKKKLTFHQVFASDEKGTVGVKSGKGDSARLKGGDDNAWAWL
jgi:hypothetical protein